MAIPSWLHLSQVSGNGDTIITITADTYSELTNRYASIVVSGVEKTATVEVTQRKVPPVGTYLSFVVLSNGTIKWVKNNSDADGKLINYRINGGQWQSAVSSVAGVDINVSQGDVVEFKGNNASYCYYYYSQSPFIAEYRFSSFSGSTASFNITGNIMSLVYGDNFYDKTVLTDDDCFNRLFTNTNVVSANDLVLPATTLTNRTYEAMFLNCKSLTSAPSELPAASLTYLCYGSMFLSCTALTEAPIIQASSMGESSCYLMFGSCSSLVTPPALPATSLGQICYAYMFYNCTSLATAPALPATTLVGGEYQRMFQKCVSLTTAPVLPAKTLKPSSYYEMFDGCSALTSITCYATSFDTNSTKNWVRNVAPTGTFVKDSSMSGWTVGVDGIPTGWTVQDDPSTVFSVSPSTFNFPVTGGSVSVLIKSPSSWSIDIPSESYGIPYDVSPMSGQSGSHYVTVTAYPTPWSFPKSQTFTVSNNDSSITCYINQERNYFNAIPAVFDFEAQGGTSAFTVNSEYGDWSVIMLPTWLTVSPMSGDAGTTNLVLTAAENQTGSGRTATFEISRAVGSSGLSQQCRVTQNA